MAPRGRPPKRRTSRMDAAIDAMSPFGFSEEVVIAKMRQLLKEYGGQDGYGFIELDAYGVLLEALLADQDKGNCHDQNQEQVAVGETSMVNEINEAEKAGFVDIPVCSSTPATIPPPPPPPQRPLVAPLPPPPPVVEVVLPPPPVPPVMNAILPPPENSQPRRRTPCHGWTNDDEKWHFITLPSSFNRSISPPVTPPAQPVELELTSGRKNRPKRRSRWDLMPEDM